MILDHLAVAGETLATARAHVEEALGMPMQPGGQHAVFATHNALMGLADGLYLEAISTDPGQPAPTRARWFDLDRFAGPPRLQNWICRTNDMAELAACPDGAGAPVDLTRGDLRWQMSVPEDGVLPFDNVWPALIRWQVDAHPAQMLKPTGVALKRLVLCHPEADSLRAALRRVLSDARVVVEAGEPALRAEFETPHGPRTL
ncbi:MAG: VOC family protein [Pseudomonadota bacterium]